MKLSEQDSKHYFQLMWALQFYANDKRKIHTDIKSIDEYANAAIEQKALVRNAVFEDVEIIDAFVQENPQNFSVEDLMIIQKWKEFIKGQFFIERILKKYAVFIQDDDVYAVLGISEDLDVLACSSRLPLYVNAILLPFKGEIIYDGFLGLVNIYFGGGIKHRLRETYMRAKQNQRVIESLETSYEEKSKALKPQISKNWTPELDELADRSKKLRGSREGPAIHAPAFALVKASIGFAQLAASDPDDVEGLFKMLAKVRRAYHKSNTVLSREEY